MTVQQYNQCVTNYSDDVYRFIFKNLSHSEDARDIVQSSFLTVWDKREDVEFEKAKSFLFTVAYRKMIDHLRKRKRETLKEEFPDHVGGQTAERNNLRDLLNRALKTLPEIQQHIVLLKDYEGYSYQEMQEITGIDSNQVKVYLYRARISLKNAITELEQQA
jgi:RNA polymerase sigma-70 factor (ECF subfamily)